MMQWVPYGAPEAEFKEHIRTFAAIFPHVLTVRGAGGYGAYMLGSEEPIVLDPEVAREVLARPGVLEDISSAYDSPADDRSRAGSTSSGARRGWRATPSRPTPATARSSPTTDPRPEYFLLRRLFGLDTGSGPG